MLIAVILCACIQYYGVLGIRVRVVEANEISTSVQRLKTAF